MPSINKKRIAKNTIFLYIRMALNMAIALYTSRVLLRVLGIDDYGLYSVIGGVVVLFSFLNSTLAGSTSRFLTFALGKGEQKEINRVFSASLTNHVFMALLILILAETIGLYLVYNKLVIPPERFHASLWVYQFSIMTAMLTMTQLPYNACIIAHEKMNAFAYLSIGETILKLIVVIVLQFIVSFDRLILYSIMILVITILITLSYRIYCNRHFEECTYHFFWDKALYKKLFSYAGWDLLGGFSVIAQGQGLNILLNMFFGPAVNASRAISVQVQSAIGQFSTNFMMASRPQIIKSYAEGKTNEMLKLVYQVAKYGFALSLFFTLPIFVEMEYILRLWLVNVPEFAVIFCRIMLIISLINVLRNPFIAALHATGNIRLANILCGSLLISTLPIAYLFLKMNFSPISVFGVTFAITFIVQWVDLLNLKRLLPISLKSYFIEVYIPSIFLLLISFSVIYFIPHFFSSSLLRLFIVVCTSWIVLGICSYIIILNSNTRDKIKLKTRNFLNARKTLK